MALLTMVASMSYGQVTQVVSRNAVGYVRVEAEKGKFYALRYDFFSVDGSPVPIVDMIGDQVPQGSAAYKFQQGVGYIAENKGLFGWFPGTNTYEPGEGFWLAVPGTAVSNVYNVFLMGEVPDRFTAPTSMPINVASGFSLLGFPYPTEMPWTSTVLASNAVQGDAMYKFDPDVGYISENRGLFGWFPGTNVLYPGDGFWVSSSVGGTWEEVKPYTWP
jgi:hypothetical protein